MQLLYWTPQPVYRAHVTALSSLLTCPHSGSMEASSLPPRANYRLAVARLQKDICKEANNEKEQDDGSSCKYP